MHGRGTSVVGAAGDDDPPRADAHDGIHDTHGQSLALQHRPLLDVGLDEARPVVPAALHLGQCLRVQAVGRHDVVGRNAVRVCQLLQKVRFHQSGQRPAAQNTGAEGVALLLHDGHRLKGMAQGEAVLLQHSCQLQPAGEGAKILQAHYGNASGGMV